MYICEIHTCKIKKTFNIQNHPVYTVRQRGLGRGERTLVCSSTREIQYSDIQLIYRSFYP